MKKLNLISLLGISLLATTSFSFASSAFSFKCPSAETVKATTFKYAFNDTGNNWAFYSNRFYFKYKPWIVEFDTSFATYAVTNKQALDFAFAKFRNLPISTIPTITNSGYPICVYRSDSVGRVIARPLSLADVQDVLLQSFDS